MRNRQTGGVVEDIWMNTQADADDFYGVEPAGPDGPASWREIEEENILINPDAASMEGRG